MNTVPIETAPVVIAVDFDGTLAHEVAGRLVPDRYAVACVPRLVGAGASVVLCTARVGAAYEEAKEFLRTAFPAITCSGPGLKPKADFYIDDKAVGCPQWVEKDTSRRRVNWPEVTKFILTECIDRTMLHHVLDELEEGDDDES